MHRLVWGGLSLQPLDCLGLPWKKRCQPQTWLGTIDEGPRPFWKCFSTAWARETYRSRFTIKFICWSDTNEATRLSGSGQRRVYCSHVHICRFRQLASFPSYFFHWARVFCDYKQRARTHFNFVCKTKKCGGNQFVWSMSVRYCSTRGTWWVTCVDWFRDLQRHVVMPAPWTTLRRPLLKMRPLKLRFNDFYVTINIYQRGWRGDI